MTEVNNYSTTQFYHFVNNSLLCLLALASLLVVHVHRLNTDFQLVSIDFHFDLRLAGDEFAFCPVQVTFVVGKHLILAYRAGFSVGWVVFTGRLHSTG